MIKIKVLFVCLGNICRSPTAEGIFRKLVAQRQLAQSFVIDSAGISAMVGWPADTRAQKIAQTKGIDLSSMKARQLLTVDFDEFDWIIVMDEQNLQQAQHYAQNQQAKKKLYRLLDFVTEQSVRNIIDPYYGNEDDFENRFELMQTGCENLLEHILQQHKQHAQAY